MKKTKERTVDGDLFYFLEVVSSFVCMLQGYVGSKSDGVNLGGFDVSQALNDGLFFCAWWSFGNGGSSIGRMVDEFNKGVAMERIKRDTFQKLSI